MVTIEQYFMGRDAKYPCDAQIKVNAEVLLPRVNALLEAYTAATGNEVSIVNSGWRPPALNACVANASKTSYHMTGQAIDLHDEDEALDTWLMTAQGTQTMVNCELWHESPTNTPRWAHLQSLPPRSGNRTFFA
jgi:hypothetical protein